jgi:hypothetical protein
MIAGDERDTRVREPDDSRTVGPRLETRQAEFSRNQSRRKLIRISMPGVDCDFISVREALPVDDGNA